MWRETISKIAALALLNIEKQKMWKLFDRNCVREEMTNLDKKDLNDAAKKINNFAKDIGQTDNDNDKFKSISSRIKNIVSQLNLILIFNVLYIEVPVLSVIRKC